MKIFSLPLFLTFLVVSSSFSPWRGEGKTYLVRLSPPSAPLRFAASELEEALNKRGMKREEESPSLIFHLQVAGKEENLEEEEFLVIPEREVLRVRMVIKGGGARGTLYGGLEIAERILLGADPEQIEPCRGKPFLKVREYKFNIPLPGTGYLSQEALRRGEEWFFDLEYWKRFLDSLARWRYNRLSLWSAHPFAHMLKLGKYPEATHLSRKEYKRREEFFKSLFRLAKDRCIETFLITWNIHVSEAFSRVRGIPKDGHDSPLVRDYMKECIRELVLTYTDLTGIGTCPGEAMPMDFEKKEEFIQETYIKGILESGRIVPFTHRYWGGDPGPVEKLCANYPGPVWVTLKYNGEHMYSSPKPHFVNWKWIETQPRHYRILWHLRNDDLFNLRWGDPVFVRETVLNCTSGSSDGFLTGSEIRIPGVDDYHTRSSERHKTWEYEFEKQWFRFMLWGRLGYDPRVPEVRWRDLFAARFGEEGSLLYQAMAACSRLYPLLTSFHWNYMNGDWYPEGNIGGWNTGEGRGYNFRDGRLFHSLWEFIFNHTISDEYLSIPEYAAGKLLGDSPPAGGPVDPLEVALRMEKNASEAEECLSKISPQSMEGEMECTRMDLEAQILLNRYYAHKIRGASLLFLFLCGMGREQKEMAVESFEKALECWKKLAALTEVHYREHEVWLFGPFSWKKYLPDAERDLAEARAAKPDSEFIKKLPFMKEPRLPDMFDFRTLKDLLYFEVENFNSPPLEVKGGNASMEVEEFSGSWRVQANYPGYLGRGFRCSTVWGSQASHGLQRRIRISREGPYSFWARGLVGHRDMAVDRSFRLGLDDHLFPPTHLDKGEPRFVWEKAGVLHLEPGEYVLHVLDHGPGWEHPDAVALSDDPQWDPAAEEKGLQVLGGDGPRILREYLESEIQEAFTALPLRYPLSELEEIQKKNRETLQEALGLSPFPPRPPFAWKKVGEIKKEGFRIEKIVFESQPGFPLSGLLYVPTVGAPPFPAVVNPVGHWGRGKAEPTVQARCMGLAKQGFIAFCLDTVGQEERRAEGNRHRYTLGLYPSGSSILGIMVWDILRAVDFLTFCRQDVDREHIGCCGASGGGMITLYAAALDPRIKAAVSTCYFTDFRGLLSSGNHCECNYIPGLIPALRDMDHVAACIAPRPYLVIAAKEDFLPVQGTRRLAQRLSEAYKAYGAPDSFSLCEFDGGHAFNQEMREKAYEWFRTFLREEKKPAVDEKLLNIQPESPEALYVFPGGKYPASSKTALALAQEKAQELVERIPLPEPDRLRLWQESLRKKLAEVLQPRSLSALLNPEASAPWAADLKEYTYSGDFSIFGLQGKKVMLTVSSAKKDGHLFPAKDFPLPGLFLPPRVIERPGPCPCLLVVADEGKGIALESRRDSFRSLLYEGWALFFLDPRGMGETAGDDEGVWRASILTHVPIFGSRVEDVLAGVRYLRKRGDVSRVVLLGDGPLSSTLVLFAAALNEEVSAAAVFKSFPSFSTLIREGIPSPPCLYIPGILKVADIPHVMNLIAPRPLLLLSAESESLFEAAKRLFEAAGAGKNFHCETQDHERKLSNFLKVLRESHQ